MKILIVSDTHRKTGNLLEVLERVKDIDLLIHLGDVEGDEEVIKSLVDCPVEIVAGNNDFFSNLDKEKELRISKYKILITHGHYYYVSLGTENLRKEAVSRSIDIVMFGHTHVPLLEQYDDITLLNPGSISYPRQHGRKPSYMIMEIDADEEAHFHQCYLE